MRSEGPTGKFPVIRAITVAATDSVKMTQKALCTQGFPSGQRTALSALENGHSDPAVIVMRAVDAEVTENKDNNRQTNPPQSSKAGPRQRHGRREGASTELLEEQLD